MHRDVKPSNIILCEEDCTFRLIDLGAMADLRTGTNYVPGESILDPYYCPPEQYVLPTDTPDLAKTNRMMSLAMSAMLWNRHKPDRFDSYSIGLILMQLAVPQLRMKSGLQVCTFPSLGCSECMGTYPEPSEPTHVVHLQIPTLFVSGRRLCK